MNIKGEKTMKRRTFDGVVTLVGFGLGVFLLIAAGLLNWGYTFANGTVKSQLEAQQITFPAETGNPKDDAATTAFFKENGKKIMTTGKQAQMYADYYIAFHMEKDPPYAAASGLNRAAAAALAADPANPDLQAKAAEAKRVVEQVFKGEMLRGTLLTSYAFWQLGEIAKIAAVVTLIGGLLLLLLSLAGLVHLRRTPHEATI